MNISHFPEAYQLWGLSKGTARTVGDTEKEIKFYLDRNPGTSFVCLDKATNKLIGTILCGHDGRRGFIYHLAVHPDFRKRSIGKKLVETALAKLKAAGIQRCIIMVKEMNE